MYVAVIVKKGEGANASHRAGGSWDAHLGETPDEAASKAQKAVDGFPVRHIYEILVGQLTQVAIKPPVKFEYQYLLNRTEGFEKR